MTDHDRAGLINDLELGYAGDAWHGPPLKKVLEGVTAAVAHAHPVPNAHSIWEVVAHLAAWDGVVADRIIERRTIEEPEAGNFPAVAESSAEAWASMLSELDRQHGRLVDAVRGLEPAHLAEPVAGKNYSTAHMIRGVPQHMSYHAGQIALLRKLAESSSEAGLAR